jgi:2-polyprenyl-6-methoxyphenol hydroxylase-like FAD-dependent oxidoreductase
MAKPTISIVGAGFSGLALGCCLRQRGISAILYERAASPAPHGYGITLHAATYAPLLKALDVDERAFRSRVAVDATVDGSGWINNSALRSGNEGLKNGGSSFRANRGKLEEWLREGLDVRWKHVLQHVEHSSNSTPVLYFENGQEVHSDIVVGADGPHSSLRNSVLPGNQPIILSYVVFNGKRRIDRVVFEEKILPYMEDSTVINIKRGDVRVNVSINEYMTERVSISWTYSRPSRGAADTLHAPDRALSSATVIPEQLFEELVNLFQSGLPKPFAKILEPAMVRKDRILHWLMRTILVQKEDLQSLAQRGVMLVGDAAHAEPIVGGNGANSAIQDAVELAEEIAKSRDTGTQILSRWIDQKYTLWLRAGKDATENIATLHKDISRRL